ncbi:tetratricopeptide repeat protein [Pseudomonas tohonis]|uniref:hypothetical protein n=1 Tax=Pseudomonas tohonis TaxID=2725477 RepID=UPI0021D9E5C1|nr:hypothetical protein [Pseudomonas tohonis]UXY54038.1 hypothetical protein N9L84_05475 [Pseudomonas tohonis]
MTNYDPSDAFKKISRLMKEKSFNLVIEEYKNLKNEQLTPCLLIMKSTAIQLAEDSQGYTLDDAKEALFSALALDPENPETLMELGYFYYAVEDNTQNSITFFDDAAKKSRKILLNSIMGGINARLELGLKSEAKGVMRMYTNFEDDMKIQELLASLNS